MESPEKLKGKSVRLLDPRPVCWETLNGNILEGPEVVCYRDKYYMIYAANHTSTRYGNYLMGCAAADSPLGFNETSKYPYPVMEQSDERISDSAKTLIAWGANGGPEWRFTTKHPEKNWISPDFSESKSWQKGTGGFGWPVYKESRNHNVQTPWISSDIWMRLEFELSELPSKNLQLKVRHLDSVEIYFNGIQVHTNDRWAGPKLVELSKKDIDALRVGKNIIAVHCNGTRKEKYLDIGLIDAGNKLEDDLIWNTGQPNLLRGLNGFEWYMIYFAMWNEGPHCQGINRTFFFDRELYVDGPTGLRPPQYQPIPYPATFSDNFENHSSDKISKLPKKDWECFGGEWRIAGNQVEVAGSWPINSPPTGSVIALIRANPAENYLFQAWVKPLGNKKGKLGIVAWKADKNNYLIIYFDAFKKKLIYEICINGNQKSKSHSLPKDFNFSVYHKIRFEKNGRRAEVWIDDTCLTLDKPIKIPSVKPGLPGLFAKKIRAAFDAVIYTIGWDEYDNRIHGWKPVIGSKDNVKIYKKYGLVLDAHKNKVVCTKGDLLKCYEFSTQVNFMDKTDMMAKEQSTKNKVQKAGVLPIYIDEKNWLAVEVDPLTHRLIVTGRRRGKDIQRLEKDLAGWQRFYLRKPLPEVPSNLHISASFCGEKNSVDAAADGLIATSSKESLPLFSFWDHLGTREWIQYDFDEIRKISGTEVVWYDDERTDGDCRIFEFWKLLWWCDDGTWQPVRLKKDSTFATTIDKLNVVRFETIETKALKMKVKSKKGFSSGLYEWTVLDSDSDSRIEFINMHLKRVGLISGVKLRFENHAPFSSPMDLAIQYRDIKGNWKSVKKIKQEENIFNFKPVETDRLRLKLMVKPGTHCKVARAMAYVKYEPSFNIRSVKLPDKVLIMINGKQKLEIPGRWPESQVGVSAENCAAVFNGITCFQIE